MTLIFRRHILSQKAGWFSYEEKNKKNPARTIDWRFTATKLRALKTHKLFCC